LTTDTLTRRSAEHQVAYANVDTGDEPCASVDGTDDKLAEPGTRVERGGTAIVLQQLDAARMGAHAVTVRVEAGDGTPLAGALVFVTIRMPAMDHGTSAYPAIEVEPGRYRAEDVSLGMGGAWVVAVEVIRQARAPISVAYLVQVAG